MDEHMKKVPELTPYMVGMMQSENSDNAFNRTSEKACQRQNNGFCGKCVKCTGKGSKQYEEIDNYVGEDDRDRIVITINILQVFRRKIENGEEKLSLNPQIAVYNGVSEEINAIIQKIQPLIAGYNESKIPAVALMSAVNMAIHELVDMRNVLDEENRMTFLEELCEGMGKILCNK